MTLDRALRLAFEHNPTLEAQAWETRSYDALTTQAKLPSNPEFFVDVENVAGSGAYRGTDSAETTFGVSMPLELGGMRSKRARVAHDERRLAEWAYEGTRLDVYTDVATAFAALWVAQEQLAVANERIEIASEALELAQHPAEASDSSQFDRSRANVALSRARVARDRRRARVEIARLHLAATWGGLGADFDESHGHMEQLEPPPPLEFLLGMIDENPDLARWDDEINRLEQVVAMESAKRLPDVALVAGMRHLSADDDNAAVFAVSVPIPLFDRNQGNHGVALAQLGKGKAAQRAARIAATQEVALAHERAALAIDVARRLKEDAQPEAGAALREARESHQAGRGLYQSVLVARSTFLDVRDEYLEALLEYQHAAASLNRLVGRVVLGPRPALAGLQP